MLRKVRGDTLVIGSRRFLNFDKVVYAAPENPRNESDVVVYRIGGDLRCEEPLFDVLVLDLSEEQLRDITVEDLSKLSTVLKVNARIYIPRIFILKFQTIQKTLKVGWTFDKSFQLITSQRIPVVFDIYRN